MPTSLTLTKLGKSTCALDLLNVSGGYATWAGRGSGDLASLDANAGHSGTHQRELAARAVPFPRLLALLDVLPDPGQTRANKAASVL